LCENSHRAATRVIATSSYRFAGEVLMLCPWNSFPRHTELEGGHEKIIGKFETESGKAHLGHEAQLIQVGTSGAFEKP